MAHKLVRLFRKERKDCLPSLLRGAKACGRASTFGQSSHNAYTTLLTRATAANTRKRLGLVVEERTRKERWEGSRIYEWHLQTAPFSNHVDGNRFQQGETKDDAPSTSWLHRFLPARVVPFALLARLDKPVGTWLLAWPCMWSIALATPVGLPDWRLIGLFGTGAILLRGAGCTINDLLDRDIDRKVERTKSRPIACGMVTPFQAIVFLGFQLLSGLGILVQLNTFSQIVGAFSLLLVGTYPLFKRFTYWPQAYLGLTFNWGAVLGWAAVKGSIYLPVVGPLYFAGICWTLVYDTIYAHQDKHDDLKVGVKSTALLFGEQTKRWLTGFSTATICSLTVVGHNAELGWPFYISLLGAGAHLSWQVSSLDVQNHADCNLKFVSNKWFGAIVFLGIAADRALS